MAEFVSSGMRRSEFCRSRGLSFSTLDRHLKKRRLEEEEEKRSRRRQVGGGGIGHQETAGGAAKRVAGWP